MFIVPLKDYFSFYSLLIVSIIGSYFLNEFISSSIFLIILAYFYKAKEDIIYLALTLTIISQPGFLFYNQTERILSISLLKMSYIELFSIIALMKYFTKIKDIRLVVFKTEYLFYLLGFIFFVIYGIQFGMIVTGTTSTGLGLIRRILKFFLLVPLFITIPYMIREKYLFYRFLFLIFSLNIFNFLTQLVVMLSGGTSIHALFHGAEPLMEMEGSRPVYGMYIGFLSFVFALYLLYSKDKYVANYKMFLNITVGISFFSVFLSATRGWMLAYILIGLLTYIYYFNKSIVKIVIRIIPIIGLVALIYQINFIKTQVDFALSRFETLELIYEGDPTAGGTNSRLTDRSDPVMAEFMNNPMMGWGISAHTVEYYDVHVGNQSMLLTGGIVGYSLILIFLISINLKILRYRNKLRKYSDLSRGLIIFNFVFIGMFLIHSSSTDLFGFMVFTYGGHVGKIIFHAILFSVITMFINFSLAEYQKNQNIMIRK